MAAIQGDGALHSISILFSGTPPIPPLAVVSSAPEAAGTMSCPFGHNSRAFVAQSFIVWQEMA
jgi:hypothetical protein